MDVNNNTAEAESLEESLEGEHSGTRTQRRIGAKKKECHWLLAWDALPRLQLLPHVFSTINVIWRHFKVVKIFITL